jgi:hypothetical protein
MSRAPPRRLTASGRCWPTLTAPRKFFLTAKDPGSCLTPQLAGKSHHPGHYHPNQPFPGHHLGPQSTSHPILGLGAYPPGSRRPCGSGRTVCHTVATQFESVALPLVPSGWSSPCTLLPAQRCARTVHRSCRHDPVAVVHWRLPEPGLEHHPDRQFRQSEPRGLPHGRSPGT